MEIDIKEMCNSNVQLGTHIWKINRKMKGYLMCGRQITSLI